jgi:nucleoid DNA-binding protein
VNKRGLVAVCAPRLGGRVAAEAAVEAIFDAIVRELVAGGRVVLTGFGTFEAVERKHMDGATAWTNKTCAHCAACATTYLSDTGEREWGTSGALDWLRECHGIEFAGLLAVWRYPDGSLMPPPFEHRTRPTRAGRVPLLTPQPPQGEQP